MEMRAAAHPALRLALLGWATGALFFFYAWIMRVAPSVMIDELMRDFAIGGAAVGNLSAFYFCKRRSNNPSLKRPDNLVAPE